MQYSRVGVIGAGVMGEATIVSLLKFGIAPNSIVVSEKKPNRATEIAKIYGVSLGSPHECDVVFLVIKPQDYESAIQDIKREISEAALVVSFMAGKKLSQVVESLHSTQRIIRVMPNTPMILGKAYFGVSLGDNVTKRDVDWLKNFLSSSGKIGVISEESQDALTALSGSGPAYFFGMVSAMAIAGERLGLGKDISLEAAKQVIIGAAAMIEETKKEPRDLMNNVTSTNGTTAAALRTFEASDWEEIVYRAMKAAMDRSRELSN